MGQLDKLKAEFIPKRTFKCSHSKIEVDGVFIRIPEDADRDQSLVPLVFKPKINDQEEDSWTRFQSNMDGSGQNSPSHFAIDMEDILQDPAVIRSARVSTGRDSLAVDEKAQGMMNYLWRDNHKTPYESGVVIRLKIETPISYADPLFRLFASFNEFSGRYSNIDTGFYTPQGLADQAREQFDLNAQESEELYRDLLSMGLAKEMARLCMPYRYYTKLYMTISLRHILEFMSLNESPNRHTQTEFWEIRGVFEELVKNWTPWAYKAFRDHGKKQDFGWLLGCLKEHSKKVVRLPYLSQKKVLDRGLVRLLEVKGNQDLMFTCMDDFPNPLRGFGHGSMTMLAHIPIHVLRQWVRHRYGTFTHLSVNYDKVVENDLFFIPDKFRKQEGKVGSYIFTDMNPFENEAVRIKLLSNKNRQLDRYRALRALNVPAEVAMFVLPTCFYNWIVVTKPLESLFNFCSLRTDSHAQKEIRDYADAVWELFGGAFPDIAEMFSSKLYWGDSESVKNFKPE